MTSSGGHEGDEGDEPRDARIRAEAASSPEGPSPAEEGGARHGVCELCGGPTFERHCKIVCLNCGYRRDCSDP